MSKDENFITPLSVKLMLLALIVFYSSSEQSFSNSFDDACQGINKNV